MSSKDLSYTGLLCLFVVMLTAAASMTYFVAHLLSETIISEVRTAKSNLLVSSIKAGPVEFARLHSANFAQQQLDKLLNSNGKEFPNLISIEITGGAHFADSFAKWGSMETSNDACVDLVEYILEYPDRLTPLRLVVRTNSCTPLPEEVHLRRIILFSVSLLSLLAGLAFLIVIWPVLQSTRAVGKMLEASVPTELQAKAIRFLPLRRLAQLALQNIQTQRNSALVKLAQQVAHDIRSPLSALDMIVGSTKELGDDRVRLLRRASERINEIANKLLISTRGSTEVSVGTKAEPSMVSLLALTAVNAKQTEFISDDGVSIKIELNAESYPLFSAISRNEFNSVISNLVNNAVEARKDGVEVVVRVVPAGKNVQIEISDNGKGVSKQMLPKMGIRGQSFGKPNGTGLGVYHAMEFCKNSGGTLSIQSDEGKGTTVRLNLPHCVHPDWFLPGVDLRGVKAICVGDDDETQLGIWRLLLRSKKLNINVSQLATTDAMERFMKIISEAPHSTLFVVDHDFRGESENGLDIIRRYNRSNPCILVTNRFDDEKIREEAVKLGIKILPKPLIAYVPLLAP